MSVSPAPIGDMRMVATEGWAPAVRALLVADSLRIYRHDASGTLVANQPGFRTFFDESGVNLAAVQLALEGGGFSLSSLPSDPGWAFRYRVEGYGAGGGWRRTQDDTIRAEHAQGLIEEYQNLEDGLEQRFIVEKAPMDFAVKGSIAGQVELRLEGPALVVLHRGRAVLRASAPRASDKSGRTLPARFAVGPGRLDIEVLGASAFPVTIDPQWTSTGDDRANAWFGFSVASAGDVNGDGFDDVVVAAPYHSTAAVAAGKVYLFLGSAGGLGSSAAWSSSGDDHNNAHFGFSVAPAGDVNGDHYADLLVGAPDFATANAAAGKAYLYLGSMNGLQNTPSWTSSGDDQAQAAFGTAVAGAGDVNKDGFADILVGAPSESHQNVPVAGRPGKAFLFLGSGSAPSNTPAWTSSGANQNGAGFGWSVAGAGDVNGDGFADWLVGANLYDAGAVDSGRAYLFLGSAGVLPTASVWDASGDEQKNAQAGCAVAGAGDVNGDHYADILIGAPGYGRAYLYFGGPGNGPKAAYDWSNTGERAQAQFGWSLASAGDVDGDGFADVIIGASMDSKDAQNAGRAYLFLGSSVGPGTAAEWTGAGDDRAQAQFGWSVASAGDVNADGFADLLVGAFFEDGTNPQAGKAFLYYGSGSHTGVCSSPGTACDDKDPCTKNDTCDANGVCRGTAYTCNDNNSCTDDTCNGDGTCTYAVLDNVPCDDADKCTHGDTCHYGVCQSTPTDCSALADQCHTGACDPTTGACRAQPVADSTPCDDHDPCTTGETCQGGVCLSKTNTCKSGGCGCGGQEESVPLAAFLLLLLGWRWKKVAAR